MLTSHPCLPVSTVGSHQKKLLSLEKITKRKIVKTTYINLYAYLSYSMQFVFHGYIHVLQFDLKLIEWRLYTLAQVPNVGNQSKYYRHQSISRPTFPILIITFDITTVVINADQTKTTPKTYKDSVGPNVPGPINHLNLNNFKKIQRLLFKVHTNQTQIPGLYIGVHAYLNQTIVCTNKTPFCEDKINYPCKIKSLFRKVRLDLDQFKSFGFEDLVVSAKSLLDYGSA